MLDGWLDTQRAARNFSAAAARYDETAQLQALTRAALLAQLPSSLAPQRILDLGCGTGLAVPALQARYPQAQILALDRAEGMAQAARCRGGSTCVVGDAQALPLAAACCDLLFSNLALQWCPQLPQALAEARRVLRPGGVLLLSMPAQETLAELRAAWRSIDDAEHVHRFASVEVIAAAARAAGLGIDTLALRWHHERFASVRALMQSLRGIGAANASATRRRGLLARSTLARLEAAYPRAADGGDVVANWQIAYACLRRSV